MTETSEQRIERVARAIKETGDKIFGTERSVSEACVDLARAADAISFRAGWDAAIESLRRRALKMALSGADEAHADYAETIKCAGYLEGETP